MFEGLMQFLTGKCKHHKKCEFFRSEHLTCNKHADKWFCGRYRRYDRGLE